MNGDAIRGDAFGTPESDRSQMSLLVFGSPTLYTSQRPSGETSSGSFQRSDFKSSFSDPTPLTDFS